MATFKQGILGGISGKVGPVIGTSWKGRAVLRSRALSIHDPNTQSQIEQRARFGLLSHFISQVYGFVAVGFHDQATEITEANICMKLNFDDGITGTYPAYDINYNKLILSKGTVALPYGPSASYESGALDVIWTDNSGIGNAKADDKVMILAYNKSKGQALYDLAAANRSTRSASFNIPSIWTGDAVEVFLAMQNADGVTSDSLYLGSFNI